MSASSTAHCPLDCEFELSSSTRKCTIRWTRLGNPVGSPVIFIHGTPWSSVVWHNLAAALSSRFNIYIYDHPGFGKSPLPTTASDLSDPAVRFDASLRVRAEASAALIRHWNLDQVHVVAHDNGGLVALRLLLEHNIKIASLCLIDVVALGASGLPFFKLVAENREVFTAIPPHLMEGFIRSYVRNATYLRMPQEVEDMLCAPWLEGGDQGPERFVDEMIQAHYRDVGGVWDEYDGLRKPPIKIIWGREDSWIPCETATRLADKLGTNDVSIIDEAGHLVQYDQPSKLAVEVALWLQSFAPR